MTDTVPTIGDPQPANGRSVHQFKTPPIVEAIFEARWAPAAELAQSNHKLFVARLYDRLLKEYPEPEELPSSAIPEQFAFGQVQQRFRRTKDGWPVVQVGPGVVTLNDTVGYTWLDFKARCETLINTLFVAHPKADALNVNALQLRYIDAVHFDPAKEDVWEFLRTKMRLNITFPEALFRDQPVRLHSDIFSLQSAFVSEKPAGRVALTLGFGQKDGHPALLWEINVTSAGADVVALPHAFGEWIVAAHNITHDWFDLLTDGELQRQFNE